MDPGTADERNWEPCDLRRPTKLSREQLRSLDLFHDTLSRRLSSGVGRLARASAAVDVIRTTQLSWEEYLRTLPAVTTLVTVAAPSLPGDILVEIDTSFHHGHVGESRRRAGAERRHRPRPSRRPAGVGQRRRRPHPAWPSQSSRLAISVSDHPFVVSLPNDATSRG
jgi:hypothetical protein